MKTKEEVIKEAFEEVGLPYNEEVLKDDGWLKIKPTQYQSKYDLVDILKTNRQIHYIRPKSLKNISTNNGWIRIESESDLPIQLGKYKVVIKDRDYGMPWWIFDTYCPQDDNQKWLSRYSHYKEIEEERYPIY